MALQKTDVFPLHVVNSVPKIESPSEFFKRVTLEHRVFAFITYLNGEKIYFQECPYNVQYYKHFMLLGKVAMCSVNREEKDWHWATAKLKKTVSQCLKKNIDVRTSFMFNQHNFLVKPCFTFGQRTVEPGTAHIYQTTACPIQFYFFSEKSSRKLRKQEKLFPAEEQFFYNKSVLGADKIYRVPPNINYVIFTTHKCFFTLHIVKEDYEMPFPTEDPTSVGNRILKRDLIYDKPIQTPYIDDTLRTESEEQTPPVNYIVMQPPQPTTIIYEYPIQKNVNVVSPDILTWYAGLKRKFEDPNQPISPLSGDEQTSPLDLSKKTKLCDSIDVVLSSPADNQIKDLFHELSEFLSK